MKKKKLPHLLHLSLGKLILTNAVALELTKTTVLNGNNSLKSFVAAEEAACYLINCL